VAISARVDALITGNKRHYPANTSAGIRIFFPSEFLDAFHHREDD